MQEQEHSCLLRRLTLCDGHVAASWTLRAPDEPCYCKELATLPPDHQVWRSELLRSRARVVARSDEIQRIREQRARMVGDLDDW